jgi:hypothetical protein
MFPPTAGELASLASEAAALSAHRWLRRKEIASYCW